jgi:hypothetical protein
MTAPARNKCLRRLGAPDPNRYRQPLPGDPALPELVRIGATIVTSCRTGGEVEALVPYTVYALDGTPLACWTIIYNRPGHRGREASRCWINECVVHGGRILMLFEANTDEVFIEAQPAAPTPPSFDDLPLFAWSQAA